MNVGQPLSFSVTATGSTPLSYQWVTRGGTLVPASYGGNTATMSVPATPETYGGIALNGLRFTCTVTNAAGSEVSYGALLTVLNPTPTPTPTMTPTSTPTATPTRVPTPLITQEPADRTVTVGQPVSFSVVATGPGPLTYQWKANGATAVPASFGGNTAVMSVPATPATYSGITLNGLRFSCTITNAAGSEVSYGALLTVLNPTPTPTPTMTPTSTPTATPTRVPTPLITQEPADRTVTVGQPVSFSVVATGPGPLTYQWKANGATAVPASFGGNTAVMSVPATPATYSGITLNGLRFSCTITNPGGSVVSRGALLTVNPALAAARAKAVR